MNDFCPCTVYFPLQIDRGPYIWTKIKVKLWECIKIIVVSISNHGHDQIVRALNDAKSIAVPYSIRKVSQNCVWLCTPSPEHFESCHFFPLLMKSTSDLNVNFVNGSVYGDSLACNPQSKLMNPGETSGKGEII